MAEQIFCKTNLHLLPVSAGTADGTPEDAGVEVDGTQAAVIVPKEELSPLSGPIPVFEDSPKGFVPGGDKRYIFTHYYCIKSVAYLAPQSTELVQMLNTKFTPLGKKRSADAWKANLSVRWAIVELERCRKEGGLIQWHR